MFVHLPSPHKVPEKPGGQVHVKVTIVGVDDGVHTPVTHGPDKHGLDAENDS